jgi:hypothetical protein
MRDAAQHRGRDVAYPEVPRDYHAGVKGTFMDSGTHNRYFGSIAMQADAAFSWDSPTGAAAVEGLVLERYAARVRAALTARDSVHLRSAAEVAAFSEGVGVVWYSCPPNEQNHDKMRAVAAFFGIWHEGARGSHDGVHELWWLGSARLVLVNAFASGGGGDGAALVTGSIMPSSLRGLLPAGHAPIPWSDFLSVPRPQLPRHEALFGAVTSSMLAHLDGGDDANGRPDTGASGADSVLSVHGGAGVVVYVHDADEAGEGGEEQAADGAGGGHQHSGFMGDLSLRRGGGSRGAVARIGALPGSVKVVAAGAAARGHSCAGVCAAQLPGSTCAAVYLPVSQGGRKHMRSRARAHARVRACTGAIACSPRLPLHAHALPAGRQ